MFTKRPFVCEWTEIALEDKVSDMLLIMARIQKREAGVSLLYLYQGGREGGREVRREGGRALTCSHTCVRCCCPR